METCKTCGSPLTVFNTFSFCAPCENGTKAVSPPPPKEEETPGFHKFAYLKDGKRVGPHLCLMAVDKNYRWVGEVIWVDADEDESHVQGAMNWLKAYVPNAEKVLIFDHESFYVEDLDFNNCSLEDVCRLGKTLAEESHAEWVVRAISSYNATSIDELLDSLSDYDTYDDIDELGRAKAEDLPYEYEDWFDFSGYGQCYADSTDGVLMIPDHGIIVIN